MADLLLAAGADIDAVDEDGVSSLAATEKGGDSASTERVLGGCPIRGQEGGEIGHFRTLLAGEMGHAADSAEPSRCIVNPPKQK